MRIRYKLIISLIISITLVAFLFAIFQIRAENHVLRSALDQHAEVLAESLANNVEPLLQSQSWDELRRLLDGFENREGLAGGETLLVSGVAVPKEGMRVTLKP